MPSDDRQRYEVPVIGAVSPSLAEILRNCPLQAGMSRIKPIQAYVLGNPKAWLGTAYHHVLEHLWDPSPRDDDARIEELWADGITALEMRAKTHPLDRRFASPVQWPGYHLIHAFTVLRAKQALHGRPRDPKGIPTESVVFREQEFSAMGGKLVGKPDLILGDEIRDYKSGRIYEQTPDGKQMLKDAYVRQLRLYGRLVQEQLGRCPTTGVLLPMQGEAVEIDLDPQVCAAEAIAAVELLDKYNGELRTAGAVAELATPSPRACRWCQYKGLCPAFWDSVNGTWAEELGSSCAGGLLASGPQPIHSGRAFSIALNGSTGTTTGPLTIAPLEKSVHISVASWQAGDAVRVINLYRRSDGQLAPTAATVCLRERDSALITVPKERNRS